MQPACSGLTVPDTNTVDFNNKKLFVIIFLIGMYGKKAQ